ncbi:MAG: hypothetical protein HZA90_17415 [Verrucomicrobia bacterium]|nr:hypothetical protein [Verrucomicrobiota bacterium]
MKTILGLLLLAALPCWAGAAQTAAGEQPFPRFLYAAEGAKKIIEYGRDGQVAWEFPAEMARDVWALTNGHVLFSFNRDYNSAHHDNSSGVLEITRDQRIVWQFATTGQVWSCQRLADGCTLVGAASQGQLLIVGPDAKVVKAIKVLNKPGHSCMRNARQIPNGHFLVAEESARAAREYRPDGSLVREIKLSFAPFSVVRLDNGHTVICGQKSMVEVDAADQMVWSLEGAEIPEMGIRWFAGIQALPNGNVFICNAGGKVPFLEVSRDKKVVWQSGPGNPPFPMGHGIQRCDVSGRPLK